MGLREEVVRGRDSRAADGMSRGEAPWLVLGKDYPLPVSLEVPRTEAWGRVASCSSSLIRYPIALGLLIPLLPLSRSSADDHQISGLSQV